MIAVNDECRNVTLGQPFHFLAKRDKRTKIPVFRIVEVARNDQEVRFGVDGMVHNTRQSAECRRLELIPERSRGFSHSTKRAVQVEIRSINESQRFHAALLNEKSPRSGLWTFTYLANYRIWRRRRWVQYPWESI